MRRHWNKRFLTLNAATKFTLIVGFITLGFLLVWQYRTSIGRNEYSINTEYIHHEIVRNFTFLKLEHERALKNSFGKQISVEFLSAPGERAAKNGITLNTVKPTFPKDFAGIRLDKVPIEKSVGYVRVWNYWELMTMNTRALIALAGLAKIGGRKVLAPRVKNSEFSRKGDPLGTYFNITAFNTLLALNNYATLASEKHYEADCSSDNASHVVIHFLYGDQDTKQELHLNAKEYDNVRKSAAKVGWSKCPSLKYFIKENSKARYFCVEVAEVTEWSRLENDVIQGAQCVTITNWRGIGGGRHRTQFTQEYLKAKVKDILFALKPSGDILKEANRFRRAIYEPYIGVHIRAEKIFSAHNVPRILDCIRLLAELLKLLKAMSGIAHVLVAADTSSFGSYAWEGQEIHRTLKNLHSTLISSVGGSEYQPTAGYLDRGVVALVEMSLLARATHLVTVGKGSFQEWVKAKFLEQHRYDYQSSWSLITMCSQ